MILGKALRNEIQNIKDWMVTKLSIEEKILLIDLLKLLHRYTDEDHRLNQYEIQDLLASEYDTFVRRQTVGANVDKLISYGERDDANEILYSTKTRKTSNNNSTFAAQIRQVSLDVIGQRTCPML